MFLSVSAFYCLAGRKKKGAGGERGQGEERMQRERGRINLNTPGLRRSPIPPSHLKTLELNGARRSPCVRPLWAQVLRGILMGTRFPLPAPADKHWHPSPFVFLCQGLVLLPLMPSLILALTAQETHARTHTTTFTHTHTHSTSLSHSP